MKIIYPIILFGFITVCFFQSRDIHRQDEAIAKQNATIARLQRKIYHQDSSYCKGYDTMLRWYNAKHRAPKVKKHKQEQDTIKTN